MPFVIHDIKNQKTYLSTNLNNNIDEGMGLKIVRSMDEDYIYLFFEPEEILQHYEKNKEELDKLDNNFTKLARQISRDDFLILAKYKLKK